MTVAEFIVELQAFKQDADVQFLIDPTSRMGERIAEIFLDEDLNIVFLVGPVPDEMG